LIISSKFENIYIGIPSLERDVDIYTCRSRFVAIVVAFGFGFALASALCPLPSAAVPFPSYPIDMAVTPTKPGKEPARIPLSFFALFVSLVLAGWDSYFLWGSGRMPEQ